MVLNVPIKHILEQEWILVGILDTITTLPPTKRSALKKLSVKDIIAALNLEHQNFEIAFWILKPSYGRS